MPALTATRRATLPGLTGLRGVGALWVVALHAQYGMDLPVAGVGFLGVDMFFILSGFVLSHAAAGTRWNRATYGRFLRDRVARILPLHWLALALLALVLLACPAIHDDMPQLFGGLDLLASILLVQNWGFGRAASWNVPAWSLSTEWLVSLAFPLFLVAAERVRRADRAMALCFGCLAAFAAFLALTGNPTPDVTARAGLVRTMCEFAAGCLLYRAHAAGAAPGRGAALAGAATLGLGVAVPGMETAAVFGFPVLILLAARPSHPVARALSGRWIVLLGELSFSIYLLHWMLLQVSNRLEAALNVRGAWAALWFAGFLAVLLAASALTYHLVEVPARRKLRAARAPGVALPPSLAPMGRA